MRALVTGGAGFIGAHLVRRLVDRGAEVTVLDDFSTGSRRRLDNVPVKWIDADVRDATAVKNAAQRQDAIFHLAAVVGVPHAMRHQWDGLTTNFLGTLHVLQAARAQNLPVLLTSSSAIYGKIQHTPVNETDDVMLGNTHVPAWTYSYCKLIEELLARAAADEWSIRVKIVRLFNVIGPEQSGSYGMVVPRFVSQALAQHPLTVYGDGSQTRTFVDVEDALDGILLVWDRGAWNYPYNVGGEGEIRILDLARKVLAITESRSEIEYIPYHKAFDRRFEETPRRVPDIRRLGKLGYRPRKSLDDTLSRIADQLRRKAKLRPQV